MKKVPNNIPPDIVKLDLSYNKISQLRAKEFEDVHELKKLNLSSNGIGFIDPGKSHGVPLVTVLRAFFYGNVYSNTI